MGDSSDNVPGVPGVGPKTAVKLLSDYGSIENVLSNSNNITNKRVHKGLSENSNNALLSKKLVTIITDVELEFEIQDLIRKDINYETTSKKFKELEFQALINTLESLSPSKSGKKAEDDKKN